MSSEKFENLMVLYEVKTMTTEIMEPNSSDHCLDENGIPVEFQPSLVYVCFLLLIGIPGNSLVCAVYHKKWRKKRKATTLFILTLSWLDLINCLTTLPFGLALLLKFHSFDYPILCKLARWLSYALNASSSIILLGIAVDRLIGVRYNTKMQPFGVSRAKGVVILSFVVAFLTCWPSFILYGTSKSIFAGHIRITCLIDDVYLQGSKKIYPFVYFLYLIISNIIVDMAFIILYTLIGITIYDQTTTHKTSTSRSSNAGLKRHGFCPSEEGGGGEGEDVNCSKYLKRSQISFSNHDEIFGRCKEDDAVNEDSKNDFHGNKRLDMTEEHFENNEVFLKEQQPPTKRISREWWRSAICSSRHKKGPIFSASTFNGSQASVQFGENGRRFGPNYNTRKTTFLLFVVTLVYILTFVPYCVVATIRLVDHTYLLSESRTYKIFYQLFLRSYMLSMAVNPIIYSFLNRQFRQECLLIIKQIFPLYRLRCRARRE